MQNENPEVSGQYQTMLIVWAGLLVSQFLFLLLVFLIKPELFSFDFTQPLLGDNAIVTGIFALLALTAVAASFFLRKQNVEKAIAEQKVEHVQTGMIIGCALCEASSLLGLMLGVCVRLPILLPVDGPRHSRYAPPYTKKERYYRSKL